MMKRIVVCSLGLCLLVGAGCGGEEDSILAINLATGEIQAFSSEGAIPPGFAKCTDPTCTLPSNIACAKLGEALCTKNPNCRLKTLWCVGTGTVSSNGTSTTGTTKCEYACIPKYPLLCEELLDQKQCLARTDCEWTQGPCPLGPCTPGGVCPPCAFSCKTKVPPVTGCKSNADCGKGQFCSFKSGCGTLGPGTCQAMPGACPLYWSPVCGCDKKTYGNACEANSVGVSVAHVGACVTPPPPPPTGCKSNLDCGKSQFCFFKTGCGKLGTGNCTTRPQACAEYYSPVCGCDGKTYGNECEAHASGVSVASQGACYQPPPATCSALQQQYATELKNAKVCYPASMMPVVQCSHSVSTDLACNICTTFVNNTTQLDAIKQKWVAAGCDKQAWACPAMACKPPVSGKCVQTSAGSTQGACQDVF